MKSKYFIFVATFCFGLGIAHSAAASVSFSIRSGDTLAVQNIPVDFPLADSVTATANDGVHMVPSHSVLGLLAVLDESSNAFSISNLQNSFALYVKCMTIASEEFCPQGSSGWQYAVNGSLPPMSMDQFTVSDEDTVWVFFGDAHRIRLNTYGIDTNQSFVATAEDYKFQDNSWLSLSGVTIGVTQENPDDPFSPIEVLTSPADENGRATFIMATPGDYLVGIKEDFYFPTVALTVASPPGGSGGGGSAASFFAPQVKTPTQFSVPKAVQFLESQQKEDGSFGAPLFSDWVAVALGASSETGATEEKLKGYLLQDPDPGNLLTDYERRAMALMALGVDPAHDIPTNYIQRILEAFDGAQFGDPALVNDDVFALLVLSKAGFRADARTTKDLVFVLSKQEQDGSFAGSVDMTAAALQTLVLFQDGGDDMNTAIGRAKTYLKLVQQNDGGFGNAYATAWVLQAISALEETSQEWAKDDKTPLDVLAGYQKGDGSVGENGEAAEQKIWATAYAIPAASGLSWGAILESFEATISKAAGGEEPQKEMPSSIASAVEPQEYRRLTDEVSSLRSEIAELKQMLRPSRGSQTEETDLLAAVTLPSQEETTVQRKNFTASMLDAFVSFWNTVRSIF